MIILCQQNYKKLLMGKYLFKTLQPRVPGWPIFVLFSCFLRGASLFFLQFSLKIYFSKGLTKFINKKSKRYSIQKKPGLNHQGADCLKFIHRYQALGGPLQLVVVLVTCNKIQILLIKKKKKKKMLWNCILPGFKELNYLLRN